MSCGVIAGRKIIFMSPEDRFSSAALTCSCSCVHNIPFVMIKNEMPPMEN